MNWGVRVVESVDELEGLAPTWTDLLAVQEDPSLFLTPEWQISWFQAMRQVAAPAVVVVEDADGSVQAILPMARMRVRMGPLRLRVTDLSGSELVLSDHLGLIVHPDNFEKAWESVSDWLHGELRRVHLVRFRGVDQGPFSEAILSAAGKRRWRLREVFRGDVPYIELPGSYEEFEQSLSSNHRQQLRRFRRRLESEQGGVRYYTNDAIRPLEEVLAALTDLHARLWRERGRPGTLTDTRMQDFLGRFCVAAHRRGWLRLHQVWLNGDAVAVMLVVHWGSSAYYYQSGWETKYRRNKLGEQILAHSVRSSIEEGLGRFDLLRGEEGYKERFLTGSAVGLGVDVASGVVGRGVLAAQWLRKCATTVMRRVLPQPAVEVMGRLRHRLPGARSKVVRGR